MQGNYVTGWRLAVVTLLYVSAMNAKESAVTPLPVLIGFELAYRRRLRIGGLDTTRILIPLIVLALVTPVWLAGDFIGHSALTKFAGYAPEFSCYATFAAVLLDRIARVVAREHLFRRIAPAVVRVGLVAGAMLWFAQGFWRGQTEREQRARAVQDRTWSVIQQVEQQSKGVTRPSRILVLNDPFEDWDTYFVVKVVLGEKAGEIVLDRKLDRALTSAEIATFDVVIRLS